MDIYIATVQTLEKQYKITMNFSGDLTFVDSYVRICDTAGDILFIPKYDVKAITITKKGDV